MKKRTVLFLCLLSVTLLLLGATTNKTPLMNAFLQTDMDGNGKSITNAIIPAATIVGTIPPGNLGTNEAFAGGVLQGTSPTTAKWDDDITASSFRPVGTAVAGLPATISPGLSLWCYDVVTSRGFGDWVHSDGTNWFTRENVIATADVRQFILNGWKAALNVQTPLSTIWFAKEPFTPTVVGFPANSAVVGGGSAGLHDASSLGAAVSMGVGVGAAGGAYSHATLVSVTSGGFYGHFIQAAVNVLSSTADAYWVSTGFSQNANTNYPTSGAFFLYDAFNTSAHGITGAGTNNWIAVTCQGSSYTYTDTGFPVSTSYSVTPNRLGIILTSTNCVFYTNGAVAATHTTTLPTSAQYPYNNKIVRVHGTTARTLIYTAPAWHIRQAANRTWP